MENWKLSLMMMALWHARRTCIDSLSPHPCNDSAAPLRHNNARTCTMSHPTPDKSFLI